MDGSEKTSPPAFLYAKLSFWEAGDWEIEHDNEVVECDKRKKALRFTSEWSNEIIHCKNFNVITLIMMAYIVPKWNKKL